MSKDFNYFRIKMAYKGTNDLGAIVPIKSEDLVMATCYTEAEQIRSEEHTSELQSPS